MIPAPLPSSSTLSPLASPFTFDRHISDHRVKDYPYSPPPIAESSPTNPAGESSCWMDPSLHNNLSPFHKGGTSESFISYGDAYGAWHGKHASSPARQVHIGADSSAWLDKHTSIYEENGRDSCNNGVSYLQLPSPNLAMNECDASNSYDRYVSQLVSCSTDPVVYYPAPTCSSSPEVFNPANDPMYFASSNCYSTHQHGNLLYNVDDNYVEYSPSNKKEPAVDQYSDGREGYVKGGIAHDKMKEYNGTGNSTLAAACSSLGTEVTPQTPMDYSTEVKSGFGTKQLNFMGSMSSSSMPVGSLQTSSEIFDQPHLTVDSPCWKGAAVSQQYSFGGAEMIGSHQKVKESKGSDDLDPGQKYLPVSRQYSRNSPSLERDGDCPVLATLSFPGDSSPNLSLYGTEKRFHDVTAKGSEITEVEKEKSARVSCVISEGKNEAIECEVMNGNGNPSSGVRTVNSMLPSEISSFEGEGTQARMSLIDAAHDNLSDLNLDANNHVRNFSVPVDIPGMIAKPIDPTSHTCKCLSAGRDIRLLVKAMRGLSEVLLSSSYTDGVEWKECEDELVQRVIDNLEMFISRNKKDISKAISHAPGNEHGQVWASGSELNGTVNKLSNRSTKDAEGKFHSTTSCINIDDVDIQRSNVSGDDVFVKEDNHQAALYKSLWLQAEASLCSMKYELQLALLKLEMKNYGRQTKAQEPEQVVGSTRLNCTQGFDAPVSVNQDSKCNDAGKSSEGKQKDPKTIIKDDEVDAASVMARLEVLQISNNITTAEQPKCSDTENMFRDLSTRLVDLGFVESATPQPSDEDVNIDALSSVLDGIASNAHLAPTYSEEISEHAFGGGSLVRVADDPFPQPLVHSMCNQRNPMRCILG